MGLIDFLRDAGKDMFGGAEGREAESIKDAIESALGSNVANLEVQFNAGVVTLSGTATSVAAKEKAALIAGNVRGVHQVNEDGLRVAGAAAPVAAGAAPVGEGKNAAAKTDAARYHTVQSGDSLSKIAQQHYGDANKWDELFEANREVIEDPDKIYPGQQIRIPADLKG
ncbi:MAG TPA: peptidoglycan-binding protein LysM [Rhodothermales bacterium]|nr:peptidoglycan-binding protein LysM [Rhodothermales bacterium]